MADVPAMPENALKAFDPAKLKLTHTDYSGKTPAEARKAIVKLLENYNVVITTELLNKEKIEALLGKDKQGNKKKMPDIIESAGQMEGVCLARAFYDGTDKTAPIKTGKPVVIDTVTGDCVTGIHAEWGVDEYKIVGVALEDLTTASPKDDRRVMIRLVPPAAVGASDAGIFLTKAKNGQGYPAFSTTRRIWPAFIYVNPTWNAGGSGGGDGSQGAAGNQGKEEDIMNLSAYSRYVPEFTQLVGWKVNEKWYCQYVPAPMVSATLAEDLLLSSAGLTASVQGMSPANAMAPGEKVKTIGEVRGGYKYPSGARVLLGLVGTEYCVIKCFTCPMPQ